MTRGRLVLLLLCVPVSLAVARLQAQPPGADGNIIVSTSGPVVADGGAVSANHPLAARAGLEILKRGGNAVDAIVATVLTLCVVHNTNNGIGGYGGAMVIHRAGQGEPVVVDFNTRAPLAATAEMFESNRADLTSGVKSVALWNTVAGLAIALEKYGTMKWADVLQPAIRHAEEGIVLEAHEAASLARSYDSKLSRWPANRLVFRRPDGSPLQAGDRLVQKDLAASLRTLATEGPDAIYTGALARTMVDYLRAEGGLVSLDDFKDWRQRQVRLLRPAHARYRGHDVYTSPVATGGPGLIGMLHMLDGFDLPKQFSAASVHLMLETFKLVFADRLTYTGDPWTARSPAAGLLSRAYADERRALIDPDVAWPYARPGDPWKHDGRGVNEFMLAPTAPPPVSAPGPSSRRPMVYRDIPETAPVGDTASTSTVDRHGNMVALTMTMRDGFGSGVMVPGTGIVLNNGIGLFHPTETDPVPVPDHPNRIVGGKIAVNNMNAFLVLRDGRPVLTGGGAGGRRILTECLQLIVGMLDWGLDVQEALTLPRVHVEQKEPVDVEASLPYGIGKELEAMGHRLRVAAPWGTVHAISIESATGRLRAAREPRSQTSAAGGLATPRLQSEP